MGAQSQEGLNALLFGATQSFGCRGPCSIAPSIRAQGPCRVPNRKK